MSETWWWISSKAVLNVVVTDLGGGTGSVKVTGYVYL